MSQIIKEKDNNKAKNKVNNITNSLKNSFKKEGNAKSGNKGIAPNFLQQFIITIIIFVVLMMGYEYISNMKSSKVQDISISQLATQVNAGDIKTITIYGNNIEIVNTAGTKIKSQKDMSTSLEESLVSYGVTADRLRAVNINVDNNTASNYILGSLPIVLPLLIFIFIIFLFTRSLKGAGMQAMTFGQSKAKIIDPKDEKQKITFKDVAGVREAKQDLLEIVDFLKNPGKFIEIGAVIPKGVVMMGAPGTGKTMLARAVAGETGVPFFHLSGSEFIEMFVGVGASRVRDLFKMAKAASPAIIFIDEIDAIGRVRGSGLGGGNDEREQTLNQILVEMDGFEKNEKVIVMAATNRPDVLDPALVRPGRFDRRVTLDLPDKNDRKAILEVQSNTKPKGEDVNLQVIAERTPGFSGADLYSLMNEAAITAARNERKFIIQNDIVDSIEKVMMGPERKSHLKSKKETELTAYHEAGHALVGAVLPNADPVHKVSIISRGNAGGYTLSIPDDEKKMYSKDTFLDEIAMTLGGYAVEELIYGVVTTGPSSDLQVATAKAKDMVTRYGMSDAIGPRALVQAPNKRKNMYDSADGDIHSESLKALVDSEIERIVREQLDVARAIVRDKRDVLEKIARDLLEKENLERDDFEAILKEHGIPLK
jgi:cell division protease FtsH